jgi:nucleotide-binding universal stress UspA family protein
MYGRLRSVLVGLDGSVYSDVATELGIRWMQKSGGMLVGLGVIDVPSIASPTATPLGALHFAENYVEAQLTQERNRVEQFLSRFSIRCAEAGIPCRVLEEEGSPEATLLREAQRYDLVLLGRQTYFQFESVDQPDNTLTEVLKNSPRPIVTVPSTLPKGESVVIAYDGSLQASRALYTFWASGVGSERELHIVSVDSDHTQAALKAQYASEFLHAHKLEAQRHVVKSNGHAGEEILKKLRELNAGMLVMGAYGQMRLREFFIGSVTRHLLKHSPAPIFVTH